MMVVTSCGFFLAGHREVAYTLHVTDDTGQVVNVFALTVRTLLEVMLADVSAGIADGVRDVEGEVVATFLSGHSEQLGVLCLGKMFFEIEVKC